MTRTLSITALVLTIGFSLACGGDMTVNTTAGGGSGGAASKAACESYVAHMNGLECVQLNMDQDQMCGMLDMAPIDMSEYYACLQGAAKCEDGVLKNDVKACSSLASGK